MKEGNLKVCHFIKKTTYDDLPQEVIHKAKVCLLDLLGAILGGSQTKVAGLARDFASSIWSGEDCTIVTGGKVANCVGATFANAFQANAIDIDDGFRPVKGHPGALIIPAALSVGEYRNKSGKELLEAIVVGYEVGTRAGVIWHDYYPIYHSSGSWGSIAAAATAAKLLGLGLEQTHNALGIAEYQAPINPMMRCIDYPSMVKDGIGWGSPTGVTSALMAYNGFTGVPSIFGFHDYSDYVNSLGKEYYILKLYFKPYACCRWAQPAIAAALKLMTNYNLDLEEIQKINVYTFEESARLKSDLPRDTEEAQYNIAYPIAAALVDGEVGPRQILDNKLNSPDILKVLEKIEIIHDARFDEHFPRIAESEVEIIANSGAAYLSGRVTAKGDWDNPLTEKELKDKFYWLTQHVKSKNEADRVVNIVENLEGLKSLDTLMKLLS